MRLMADGVGVKGGGFRGDSDAAFRFLGSGVASRDGVANVASSWSLLVVVLTDCDVADALVLRFLVAGPAFCTFWYVTTLAEAVPSAAESALVLATRAERLSDITLKRECCGLARDECV